MTTPSVEVIRNAFNHPSKDRKGAHCEYHKRATAMFDGLSDNDIMNIFDAMDQGPQDVVVMFCDPKFDQSFAAMARDVGCSGSTTIARFRRAQNSVFRFVSRRKEKGLPFHPTSAFDELAYFSSSRVRSTISWRRPDGFDSDEVMLEYLSREFPKNKNIGDKSIDEVREILARWGMALPEPPPPPPKLPTKRRPKDKTREAQDSIREACKHLSVSQVLRVVERSYR